MTVLSRLLLVAIALLSASLPTARSADLPQIPDALKPWVDWATWDDAHQHCPTPFNDPKNHLCFWPSRLQLEIERAQGHFELTVTVFHRSWVPLPGKGDAWPLEVKANGAPVAVLEHEGVPSIHLGAGSFRIEGNFHWLAYPQRLTLPPQIGILALSIEGKPVEAPTWEAGGDLWLKRDGSSEAADKDFLGIKVYAALEDGIPLWLHTEVELIVSGKSREEELGTILPEGWKLEAIESPIPVAVDEAGHLKAQVRAGKWTLHADAFRLDHPAEFRYPAAAKPLASEELVAFRSRPEFRMVEIVGVPSIDVSQTSFPEKWRDLPVYRWETSAPFRMEERMRGMGLQKPAGLHVSRQWWLDEDGKGFTFRDLITGAMQQIWRLDVAQGQDLGSVRSLGQGQLITSNPVNGASGVEIRSRELNLEATGRMPRGESIPATGWRSDADALQVSLNLPPGWRLFALFGPDWVRGDWLTSWTLLDLFLLLIFTVAIFRLWGWAGALLAFFAFGLSYHEPGAPHWTWLMVLIPIALLRLAPEGWGHRVLTGFKWLSVVALLFVLAPFVARQVQQALYPQLEIVNYRGGGQLPPDFSANGGTVAIAPQSAPTEPMGRAAFVSTIPSRSISKSGLSSNLQYDAKARIQTGPGVPEWSWRQVSFGWNGPVLASQRVHPILISLAMERILTIARVVLVLGLAALLLNARHFSQALFGSRKTGAVLLALLFCSNLAQAEIPDRVTLETLRQRLLKASDAYPNAAEIPSVSLSLIDRHLIIDAVIHSALETAVALPGRLPTWSPISVLVDGKPEAALRREDGYLWIVLGEGVHQVHLEAALANVTEWEWTFALKPRQVHIEAPSWNFTGVGADGVPEPQIFFALKQRASAGQASYDRQELQSAAAVDRKLEFGLVWQVHTTVSRLTPPGKALALRIPLLPGENVLSSNAPIKAGFIEVRLGANDSSFAWESELPVGPLLRLASSAADSWVERWQLVASPVWNITSSGLAPIFEPANPALTPVWQPWPGESVALAISRPEAIAGATVTVSKALHAIVLGKRQRVSTLDLSVRCSLGEDFLVNLPAEAAVTSLTQNGKPIPVRKDADKLIIPLRPGEQSILIGWKSDTLLSPWTKAEPVQLPVKSANIRTTMAVPSDRWVLWTEGPLRGPAVRFWPILICSLLAAAALGRLPLSPLRPISWMLLVIGLIQVPLFAAALVIAWLFLLSARGSDSFAKLSNRQFNARQLLLIGLTVSALIVLIAAVGEGLLGNPEMFIVGNGSSPALLRWDQARSDLLLPRPGCLSVSIWWYRFFMLAWALWLATALITWLQLGWQNFSQGGLFRPWNLFKRKSPPPIPPLPSSNQV